MDEAIRYEGREFSGDRDQELTAAGAYFSDCRFQGCDLTAASFRGSHFSECSFEGCELSNIDLTDAMLHSVSFERCRLVGVDLGALRPDPIGLTASFDNCDLSLATIEGCDLRGCSFRGIRFAETEFRDCDLRRVDLAGCDFAAARFHGNDLREADLRGARNYTISPYENRLQGLQVELPEALGLITGLGVRLVG